MEEGGKGEREDIEEGRKEGRNEESLINSEMAPPTISPVMYRVRRVEVVIISGLPRHVFVCLENTVYYRVTMCHVDV